MDRHRGERWHRHQQPETLTYRKLKYMPVNLRKKAIREARNRNEPIVGKRRRHGRRKTNKKDEDFERCEHNAMLAATAEEMKQILKQPECADLLSDIPYDVTTTELLGEIAIAEGRATTIYVERDGLSTLTIVLHQEQPTIANLKHAIGEISHAQHTRTQRDRHEERLRRRGITKTKQAIDELKSCVPQQVDSMPPRSTGELVCSSLRNGHEHRAHVSWRFLWRAFTLFNVDTNQPINDENGRATLTDLGIENGATLKFVHRVKYFGRKRKK
ncbi:uncharacterized protein LOC115631129 [Scaptodrosophila lebanonensis]|uniref:Uncharacterized protein LOC115631129 n=1 Tax=Drosophila lebanonensis TaxID=7225 RepID=A0A6J2U6R0_DROLE|nr:uncharacterized protein LOC115631129 [Scaptodrosophila lebanonensis]